MSIVKWCEDLGCEIGFLEFMTGDYKPVYEDDEFWNKYDLKVVIGLLEASGLNINEEIDDPRVKIISLLWGNPEYATTNIYYHAFWKGNEQGIKDAEEQL